MQREELIPHLFRTEYGKIVSVLSRSFGMEHVEVAEDIVSDTFLLASETWPIKGLPDNPTAWLYRVSKNKAIDALRRNKVFADKVTVQVKKEAKPHEIDIDLSVQNIRDSQLQMMFATCHPLISSEAQVGLALSILCGFGVEEIADAFLTNKETIYKRLARSKEKLRTGNIKIELPVATEINERLDAVLTTLYLLFSEGYYSSSQNTTLRKDLCVEAMRLCHLLTENSLTDTPSANALLSLMCFHASRFEARTDQKGDIILYEEQDESLWDRELIAKGGQYLERASVGNHLSHYHLEAAIAFWHTQKKDTPEKWENILKLYDSLLEIKHSPIAALNRTYALSKTGRKEEAIAAVEELKELNENNLYHSLLGNLYTDIDNEKAIDHYLKAHSLSKTAAEKHVIEINIARLTR